MKKNLISAGALCLAFLSSCSSDSSSEDLPNNEKYIHTVHTVDTENGTDETLTVNYNTDGSVSNVSDGTESHSFVYNDSAQLTTVTGDSEPFSISEMYNAPYDGYEFGEVLQYDGNGNPKKLRLFQRDYDGSILDEYTSDITYDANANPFLHTLNKAGILDVLDNVEINFSSVPQVEELVIAKALLPVNNPKTATIKDVDGNVMDTLVANYVYDADGYPTSATFTHTDSDGSVSVSTATYTYMP
jgi:hypothetical protein